MIVDLLRNDLSRASLAGSVPVTRLFEIETYETILQMTSTIESECRPGLGLAELLGSLFPSGSVTGAPKISVMSVIRRLERHHAMFTVEPSVSSAREVTASSV